jgi:hypothetical protein
MRTLIAALALAIAIAAPGFTELAAARKAESSAAKVERNSCLSWQNEKCYWRGYPLWQWYSS